MSTANTIQEAPQLLVLKLGGSTFIDSEGVDAKALRDLCQNLAPALLKFDAIFLVIGGGKPAREAQATVEREFLAKNTMAHQAEIDLVKNKAGIEVTHRHAHQLREELRGSLVGAAHPKNIQIVGGIPTSIEEASGLVSQPRNPDDITVFVAGGLEAGQSTDAVAATWAELELTRLRELASSADSSLASAVINLVIFSDIEAIYTADPKKDVQAKAIRMARLDQLIDGEILGGKPFKPGMSIPIDPVAVERLRKIVDTIDEDAVRLYFGIPSNWKDVISFLEGANELETGTVITGGGTGEMVYHSAA